MSRPDKDAVLATISEFKKLGRALFMSTYGFADRNITYEIEHEGERFPSKAIFGAAFGKMPGETARDSSSCDGSEARKHLSKLGFEIVFHGQPKETRSDADRIRRHALEEYIEPARKRGDRSVIIRARDVDEALDLKGHWRNIWQSLRGRKLQELANVPAPRQVGRDESSATEFHFDLSSPDMNWAEDELHRRYGEPLVDTKKLLAFELKDGRQIALERDRRSPRLWIEGEVAQGIVGDEAITLYQARQGRHSNLPSRLSHVPRDGVQPRQVSKVSIEDLEQLRRFLDGYESSAHAHLDRGKLEALRQLFLEKHPEFVTFEESGSYGPAEDDYKRALVARAAEILNEKRDSDDAALGAALLDLVSGKGGPAINLLDWRVARLVAEVRAADPGQIEDAAGKLVRADEPQGAVCAFVDAIWPLLWTKTPAKPYAESRTIPTMVRALVDPHEMMGIRSTPTDNAARMLLGRAAFAGRPLAREEIELVQDLAQEIYRVMRDEWRWHPRDLWDVQGFIWDTCQKRLPESAERVETEFSEEQSMPAPTNLILYGPPGTGKTYNTAWEAVALCDGEADYGEGANGRAALMARYKELCDAGRIEFVTFHQSFGYEEFVQGLRPAPLTDESGGSAGFTLEPTDGVFKRIADSARKGIVEPGDRISFDGRDIYKLSIGDASKPEWAWLFDEAIEENEIYLGFQDIDLSDPSFSSKDVIVDAVRARFPDEDVNGNTNSIQCFDKFRNQLKVGDVVLISKGLHLLRAIGLVTGEYRYVRRPDGRYSHRRSVDWLWVDPDGTPISDYFAGNLKQFHRKTTYRYGLHDLDRNGLELLANSQLEGDEEAEHPAFVLIVDEINRANISKVFGELITLIEPDKRLGMPNSLQARLPYSKKWFGVPANLHIVGTMNTADRSIALLDTALRRRFVFQELEPRPDLLENAAAACGLPLDKILAAINDRIEYLIYREHRVGHAFFMSCGSREDVDVVMREKVIPLLQEYFFEDWSRIHAVLGNGFIERRSLAPPPGIEGDPVDSWSIRNPFRVDAYDQLISGSSDQDEQTNSADEQNEDPEVQ